MPTDQVVSIAARDVGCVLTEGQARAVAIALEAFDPPTAARSLRATLERVARVLRNEPEREGKI